jgi:ribose transport system substrate-binding protein
VPLHAAEKRFILKDRKRLLKTSITILLVIAILTGSFFVLKSFFGKSSSKQPYIIVILKIDPETMQFWQTVKAGIDTATKEFGCKVEIDAPKSEADVDGQIKIIEAAIKKRPDAIVLAASDYNKLVLEAQKIKKSGIKLITVDSGINSDISQSFIATDNVKAGEKEGQMLSALLSQSSKIAIISSVNNASTAIDREKGLKLGLSKEQDSNIIGTFFSNSSYDEAYEITKDLLIKNPDLKGIAGLNEPSATGAARAIAELKLQDNVRLVGFDNSIDEIKYIEAGVIQGTVVQKPFNMGYLCIKTAVEDVNGEKIDKRIDTDSVVITKTNMYSVENQKLLFPFAGK